MSEFLGFLRYCEIPKNLDIRKICCNHPKNFCKMLYSRVMHPEDADGIADSVDPEQEQSELGLHCLPRPVCPKT